MQAVLFDAVLILIGYDYGLVQRMERVQCGKSLDLALDGCVIAQPIAGLNGKIFLWDIKIDLNIPVVIEKSVTIFLEQSQGTEILSNAVSGLFRNR